LSRFFTINNINECRVFGYRKKGREGKQAPPLKSGNTLEISDGQTVGPPVTGGKIRGLHRIITSG
jgi:hypothetical protein